MSSWRILYPGILALVLQAGALFMAWVAASGAYGATVGTPPTSEGSAHRTLIAALVIAGVVAGTFALRGLFRLHAHRGLVGSLIGTVLLYLPVVTVSVVATWLLLVVLRLY